MNYRYVLVAFGIVFIAFGSGFLIGGFTDFIKLGGGDGDGFGGERERDIISEKQRLEQLLDEILEKFNQGDDVSELLANAYNSSDVNETMTFCIGLCSKSQEANLTVLNECTFECRQSYAVGGLNGLNYLIRFNLGLAG